MSTGAGYDIEALPTGEKYIANREDPNRVLINREGRCYSSFFGGDLEAVDDEPVYIFTGDETEAFYEYKIIKVSQS